jgi:hypothetical protein
MKFLNPLTSYETLGAKAATALRKRDYTLHSFHCESKSRMVAYEHPSNRREAEAAFRKGYKSISQHVSYF